jgi:hypothetical protein
MQTTSDRPGLSNCHPSKSVSSDVAQSPESLPKVLKPIKVLYPVPAGSAVKWLADDAEPIKSKADFDAWIGSIENMRSLTFAQKVERY